MLNNYSVVSSWGSTFSILFMIGVAGLIGWCLAWWWFNRSFKNSYMKVSNKLNNLESDVFETKKYKTEFSEQLDNYDKQISLLNNSDKNLNKSIDVVNGLTQFIPGLRSNFSNLKSSNEDHSVSLEDIKMKLGLLETKINAFKDLEARVSTNTKSFDHLKTQKADRVELSKYDYNDKFAALSKRVDSINYDEKINAFTSKIETLSKAKADRVELSKYDYNDKFAALNKRVDSINYDEKINELDSNIRSINQVKLERAEWEKFKSSFTSAKNYDDEIKRLNTHISGLEERNKVLKSEINEVEDSNSRQDNKIKELYLKLETQKPVKQEVLTKVSKPIAEAKPLVELDASGIPKSTIVHTLSIKNLSVNPNQIDDLKLIKGIGPFIEKKVHALGIKTFKQISHLNSDDVNKITDAIKFFPGRIQRDDWVTQAKKLSVTKKLSAV